MPTMGLSLESARRERWGVILAGGDGVRLRPTNFSKEILETHPERLAVLPVSGVGWREGLVRYTGGRGSIPLTCSRGWVPLVFGGMP